MSYPQPPGGYGPPLQGGYYQPVPMAPAQPVGWQCPFCKSQAPPIERVKISTAGWIVFAVLIFVCFLLCWIGLLMKERAKACSSCGTVIGQFS
jgi:hypothetical protein